MSAPTCQNLNVYGEALPGLSHIYRPDGLSTAFLSQGCILATAPTLSYFGGQTAFLIRDIQCSIKTGFVSCHSKLVG